MRPAPIRARGTPLLPALLLSLGIVACEEVEVPWSGPPPESPRDAYWQGLQQAGLAEAALGIDWGAAGRMALTRPVEVRLPHREAAYIAPEEPRAVGFRFSARRGQRLEVRVAGEVDRPHQVFLDVFRVPADSTLAPLRVASSEPGVWALDYEVPRDADYVLRIQPELLRGARYTVTLEAAPSLSFPVQGVGEGAIQSGFGAPRDGGRRDHHGVDIFAPRGTPVLAAAEGLVSRVDTTRRGGLVVWLREARRGHALYYAHLDRQLVRAGQRVLHGDTLGLVGNSGNARTTPPHLHFGIYFPGAGPVDPSPFIRHPRGAAPELPQDLDPLGDWARTGVQERLRRSPTDDGSADELEAGSALQLLGATGPWYAARLPDGRFGYVRRGAVEPLENALAQRRVDVALPLLRSPEETAAVMDSLPAGSRLPVLARYADYLLVRTPEARTGWVSASVASALPTRAGATVGAAGAATAPAGQPDD